MTKTELFTQVDQTADELREISKRIWAYAELGEREFRSSAALRERLEQERFRIREVDGMPTAFVAEFGYGQPVVGILSEFDALPGLSQKAQSFQEKRAETEAGHGCGHNLMCAGMLGTALAVKAAMVAGGCRGTIRYYACPAEESTMCKVRMAGMGLFGDLDAAFGWHPSQLNAVSRASYLAVNSVKFRFKGRTSHAAMAPELGRSALDAVELMNVGANYLREHVSEKVRFHYCITGGGTAPNIVPADAEVWYNIRAPRRGEVREITNRLYRIARGAAMMTDTRAELIFISGCHDVIPNETLCRILDRNLAAAGECRFNREDYEFAARLSEGVTSQQRCTVGAAAYVIPGILPTDAILVPGVYPLRDAGVVKPSSTDAGDVSYLVPFAQFNAATWPLGCPPHTWQACAASGSEIGMEGMLFAAKALAGAVVDALNAPELLVQARDELRLTLGEAKYVPPEQDVKALLEDSLSEVKNRPLI